MSLAIPVDGGKLLWSTQSTTGHLAIPECKTLLFPEISPDFADVTSLDSNGWEEKIPTIFRMGALTAEGNFTKAVYAQAFGYTTNRTLIYFRTILALASGETVSSQMDFAGYVSPNVTGSDIAGGVQISLTITPTGAPTFTQGT